jgi:hypothetical protein
VHVEPLQLALLPLPLALLFLFEALLLSLAARFFATLCVLNPLLALLLTLGLLLFPMLASLLFLKYPGLDRHQEFEIFDLNLLALESQKLLVESLPQGILRLSNVADLSPQGVAISVDLVERLLDRLSVLSDLDLSLLERVDALAEVALLGLKFFQSVADLILLIFLLVNECLELLNLLYVGPRLLDEGHLLDQLALVLGAGRCDLQLPVKLPRQR